MDGFTWNHYDNFQFSIAHAFSAFQNEYRDNASRDIEASH